MLKSILASTSLLFLIACGSPSNPSPLTTSFEAPGMVGGTQASRNCGNVSCDQRTEYCYQVIRSENVINVSECGRQPYGSCTVWQRDFGGGEIISSSCVKLPRESLKCTGKSGAAHDAVTRNPEVCHAGVDGSLGCEDKGLVTVSCFVQ